MCNCLQALGAELRSRRSILQDKSKDVKCLKDITACKLINGTNGECMCTEQRHHCKNCSSCCRKGWLALAAPTAAPQAVTSYKFYSILGLFRRA
jgi:hypothetical protein